MQYRSQGIKRRHSHLNCTQKLDKNSTQKLFKQPKGLAVCELQAASPLVLRVRGADKNPDSQRALERSPFVYSYEKKSIALKVFHQTNSVSETIRILGYPTRRQLYSWIDDENLPSKERKPLPRIANSPEHHHVFYRCKSIFSHACSISSRSGVSRLRHSCFRFSGTP